MSEGSTRFHQLCLGTVCSESILRREFFVVVDYYVCMDSYSEEATLDEQYFGIDGALVWRADPREESQVLDAWAVQSSCLQKHCEQARRMPSRSPMMTWNRPASVDATVAPVYHPPVD